MLPSEMIEKAKTDFSRMSKSPVNGITGFNRMDGGWMVSLETIERRAIPESMDLLGIYEVRLDADGNILSFERKKLRKRGDTNCD